MGKTSKKLEELELNAQELELYARSLYKQKLLLLSRNEDVTEINQEIQSIIKKLRSKNLYYINVN